MEAGSRDGRPWFPLYRHQDRLDCTAPDHESGSEFRQGFRPSPSRDVIDIHTPHRSTLVTPYPAG